MNNDEKIELARRHWEQLSSYESLLRSDRAKLVAGIDEAGRGPLAGPVVAAAVILPADCMICGVDDSKKLSARKREFLAQQIKEQAIAYAYGVIDQKVIDQINILQASLLAMLKAVKQLSVQPDHLLIDGPYQINMALSQTAVIGGDAKSVSIAAASILAKTYRDSLMVEMAEIYPQYDFAKHKGYGTASHIQAIRQYGICPIHRRSFCGKFVSGQTEENASIF